MRSAKTIIEKSKQWEEKVDIVKLGEKVSENFGTFTYTITKEQIQALLNGDVACLNLDGEYTALLYMKKE